MTKNEKIMAKKKKILSYIYLEVVLEIIINT